MIVESNWVALPDTGYDYLSGGNVAGEGLNGIKKWGGLLVAGVFNGEGTHMVSGF